MKQYSEMYDAYYDDETGEWLEDKCKDENCEYCTGRPEKIFRNDESGKTKSLRGTPENKKWEKRV